MKLLKCTSVAGLFAVVALLGLTGRADACRHRYSGWCYYPAGGYYYQTCVPVAPALVGYRCQYVIHYPSRPDYFYYYNPGTSVFVGRVAVNASGPDVKFLPVGNGRIREEAREIVAL